MNPNKLATIDKTAEHGEGVFFYMNLNDRATYEQGTESVEGIRGTTINKSNSGAKRKENEGDNASFKTRNPSGPTILAFPLTNSIGDARAFCDEELKSNLAASPMQKRDKTERRAGGIEVNLKPPSNDNQEAKVNESKVGPNLAATARKVKPRLSSSSDVAAAVVPAAAAAVAAIPEKSKVEKPKPAAAVQESKVEEPKPAAAAVEEGKDDNNNIKEDDDNGEGAEGGNKAKNKRCKNNRKIASIAEKIQLARAGMCCSYLEIRAKASTIWCAANEAGFVECKTQIEKITDIFLNQKNAGVEQMDIYQSFVSSISEPMELKTLQTEVLAASDKFSQEFSATLLEIEALEGSISDYRFENTKFQSLSLQHIEQVVGDLKGLQMKRDAEAALILDELMLKIFSDELEVLVMEADMECIREAEREAVARAKAAAEAAEAKRRLDLINGIEGAKVALVNGMSNPETRDMANRAVQELLSLYLDINSRQEIRASGNLDDESGDNICTVCFQPFRVSEDLQVQRLPMISNSCRPITAICVPCHGEYAGRNTRCPCGACAEWRPLIWTLDMPFIAKATILGMYPAGN